MSLDGERELTKQIREVAFQLKRLNIRMERLESAFNKLNEIEAERLAIESKVYLANPELKKSDDSDEESFNTNQYWYGGLE